IILIEAPLVSIIYSFVTFSLSIPRRVVLMFFAATAFSLQVTYDFQPFQINENFGSNSGSFFLQCPDICIFQEETTSQRPKIRRHIQFVSSGRNDRPRAQTHVIGW